ncbi:class I SAM-dependent methyltransferase [Melioribacteraceae bacterium 4301-Me]|uniref:class I SAM-dependent methyltransferase n=1 Tax=Pyranulibacter aquaticus TaxID=3163344 RepID=UPI003594D151
MPEKHYYEQKEYTEKYIIPFFERYLPQYKSFRVLEIGCAEGGLVEVMSKHCAEVIGLELSQTRIDIAKEKNPNLEIIQGDITDVNLTKKLQLQFDLLIMREVIEHVPDKHAAFNNLRKLLKNEGYLFISFPPKYSPFAGHQQIAHSFLKIIPYLHLFPSSLLKKISNVLNEKKDFVDEIKYNYHTGLSINYFEHLYSLYGFVPIVSELYLFRPIYKLRFGLPVIKLIDIPLIREAITFGCENLLQKKF